MLIGGYETQRRILSFNVKEHTFRELQSRLNVGRIGHRCGFIPNTKKVMITGGYYLDSTEILNIDDESIVLASPLNSIRCNHGMGIVTMNGIDRLATFGGEKRAVELDFRNTVEIFNTQTEKWENSDMKLTKPRGYFGFHTVKLSTILSDLQYYPARNAHA